MNAEAIRAAARALPLGLAVVAEAAWISVVGGALAVGSGGSLPHPGLVAAFVVLGIVAARFLPERLGRRRWPLAEVAIAAAATAAGVLLAPDTLAELAAGQDPLTAIGRSPAGAVLGLATIRGFRHAELPLDEDTLRHLFAGGGAAIVLSTLAGISMAGGPGSGFEASCLWFAITFAITAVLALALTRQQLADAESVAPAAPCQSWLGLVVGVVAVGGLVVAPAAAVLAPFVELTTYGLVILLFIVGAIFGWTRRTVTAVAIGLAFVVVLAIIRPFLPVPELGADPGTVAVSQQAQRAVNALPAGLAIAVGVAMAILLLVLFLILAWGRTRRPEAFRPTWERRFVDTSGAGDVPSWRQLLLGRRWLPRPPTDAAAAYIALVRDLDGRRGVAREPGETPQEHARRLRVDGADALSLDLLAADYALVRFGGVAVSAREDRRAVGRWRSLRKTLRKRAEELERVAAEAAAERDLGLPEDDDNAEEESRMPSRSKTG